MATNLPAAAPLRTNIVSRRELLRSSALLAAACASPALLSGCGSSSSSSSGTSNPPAGTQPAPTGSILSATLTVGASSSANGTIPAAFTGLSYEKSAIYTPLFQSSNANLIALFKLLGPSILRIGGNSVDKTNWNPTGAGRTSGQVAPVDIQALAQFVKAAGWKCLYGINLGGSANGSQTPAMAADEVAYAAQQFGSSLLGIEIGNEPDLFGSTGAYYAGNWSLAQFIGLWQQYRSAILAVTPGVSITGPADAGNVGTWTVPFGKTVTSTDITLLTQHYYRANGQSPTSTAAYLVTPDSSLKSNLNALAAANVGVPFRIAECNSYYNGGASGVSDAYCSSLWVIDFLFNVAQAGGIGVNLHGGGSGSGYTPIANDSSGAVIEARPEFYGMMLFNMAGQGPLAATTLSAGNLNVTAYAVQTSSGGLNVLVVNKDSNANLNLSVALPASYSSATLVELTQISSGASGPNLMATNGITIQGATIAANGSFSPGAAYNLTLAGKQLSCYAPALSAILIQLN